MNAVGAHFSNTLRLYFRSRMALGYSYLFPIIFLVAFWVLYRYEPVPLVRHMGELLTVSVLGGACFGLPTSLVSERERGVWRRYRLTPVATGRLVTGTLAARYVIAVTAGALQLALAMAIGMPAPQHPLALFVAFSAVTFAFLGLGLVIAAMADSVPAVQALGQVLFLPMLIIGGVAVPLARLPDWAQHVSAFFPGRYAVEALQAGVNGGGMNALGFSVLALLLIGAAGYLTGAALFRWESQQRFAARQGKGWLAVALAAWIGTGIVAETRGRIRVAGDGPVAAAESAPVEAPAQPVPEIPAEAPPRPALLPWQTITTAEIRAINFIDLPPDDGVVAPIAPVEETMTPDMADWTAFIKEQLLEWIPGKTADPVQRARNLLYVAAVPDAIQMAPLETFIPRLVYEQLQAAIPREDLIKILAWIVMRPDEGSLDASGAVRNVVGVDLEIPEDQLIRERTRMYAIKFLGRLIGVLYE